MAILWLRDDMGRGYCERHPDVNSLRVWGCPDCLADAKRRVAELEAEVARLRAIVQ